jgi:hypothetical protein
MGWTVCGLNPSWGQISMPIHTSLLYNGYLVTLLGLKQAGCGNDHSPPPSTEVEKKTRATPLLPLCAFMACYRVNHTLFLTYKQYFRNVYSLSLSISNSTDSLIISMKSTVKENVCTDTTVSYILTNITLTKSAYFSMAYYRITFHNLNIHGTSVIQTPEVRTSAMLLLLTVAN